MDQANKKVTLRSSMTENLFSQWGEEYIVSQLLNVTRDSKKMTLVEFGGSRGPEHSNFLRFATLGYRVVMIEGNPKRFNQLRSSISRMSDVVAIQAWVGTKPGEASLEEILENSDINPNDVLAVSIDVDGDDAEIFENLKLTPLFVIIEHNPFLPVEGFFRNPRGQQIGNNLGELCRVAAQKCYFPAGLTESNLVLVSELLTDSVNQIDLLDAVNSLDLPKLGLGYDGTIVRFSSRSISTREIMDTGWSRSLIIQPVPKCLRGFGEDGFFSRHKPFMRWTNSLLCAISMRPISAVKMATGRIRKWTRLQS